MIGKILSLYLRRIAKKKSFSKKHIDRSETCNWGEAIHLVSWTKTLSMRSDIESAVQTSKTSSSSAKKRVSLPKEAHGQNFNNPAIKFIEMTKNFGSFTAVDNLNLNINKDNIFCFLGHNGAGKTTSLNVLMGKLEASIGKVEINLGGYLLDIAEDTQQA